MIEEDDAIFDEGKLEPPRGFPIHLIGGSTWLISSILPDGSSVTVKIDGDGYGFDEPLMQVFIHRNTHANLPIPVMRDPRANQASSVGDIDRTITRLLLRPPRPRRQARAAAGGFGTPGGPS
jgi:hypothetical protein